MELTIAMKYGNGEKLRRNWFAELPLTPIAYTTTPSALGCWEKGNLISKQTHLDTEQQRQVIKHSIETSPA